MITAEQAIGHAKAIEDAKEVLNKAIISAAKHGIVTNISSVYELVQNTNKKWVDDTQIVVASAALSLNI